LLPEPCPLLQFAYLTLIFMCHSLCYTEEGSRRFLWKAIKYLPDYLSSHPSCHCCSYC
jgi:hypothetical protein